ncbi:MAG: methyltransferase domain-containing protein [Myxococcales bacterium]|nr:methyltransferase domain-containing protein [Myxococcales bacterium]
MNTHTHISISDYYGSILESTQDLKTSVCCTAESPPNWLREPLEKIHTDVTERFYGCGFPIAEAVRGKTVLDLGCGTGRDVYLFSQLVGEEGFVHGIDMTREQLKVAQSTRDWHMQQFGYKKPNVAFHQGYIEELSEVKDESVDLVISNCVLNLSPRKDLVLKEVFRALKPGGEFLFSDIFSDRRLPPWMMEDQVLLGECLGGALYVGDFLSLARNTRFLDPRKLTSTSVDITSHEIRAKVGAARFASVTWRLFKLEALDDRCEDYGQIVTYTSLMPEVGSQFRLDDHHIFELGRPERVCGNTAAMLVDTRYGAHFTLVGDKSIHYGEFPCGDTIAQQSSSTTTSTSATEPCC